jgi:hypothetical protein
MLLKKRDGIVCDLCRCIEKDIFTYYSIKMLEVEVDVSKHMTTEAREKYDMDTCGGCFESHLEMARKAGEVLPKENCLVCLRCGKYMTGAFKYYIYRATKVVVDKNVAKEGPASVEEAADLLWCSDCLDEIKSQVKKNRATKGDWS